jgi:D-glycero-D-manno-heptose 1,7-bisphosphate phosphatase
VRQAAFLDRDGTLNLRPAEHEYLTSAQEFEWLPGAVEGIVRLGGAGYLLAVVSNQRGVARGLVTTEVLAAIERRIQRDLAAYGCAIDAFRYCFHSDEDGCACRKPEPGMLFELGNDLGIDLVSSWMIGDSDSDVAAGRAAGCRTALVGSAKDGTAVDVVAPSLLQAAELILARPDQRPLCSAADSKSRTSA